MLRIVLLMLLILAHSIGTTQAQASKDSAAELENKFAPPRQGFDVRRTDAERGNLETVSVALVTPKTSTIVAHQRPSPQIANGALANARYLADMCLYTSCRLRPRGS